MKKKKILLITGSSGSGKSTMAQTLEKAGIARRVRTATTRKKRQDEQNGVDYWFLSKDDFVHMDFIEKSSHYNECYGVPRFALDDALANCDTVAVVLDRQGVRHFSELFHDHPHYQLVVIYLMAENPAQQLERLVKRGDSEKQAANRLKAAAENNEYEPPEQTDMVLNVLHDKEWQKKLEDFLQALA